MAEDAPQLPPGRRASNAIADETPQLPPGKTRLLTLEHLDGRTLAAKRAREVLQAVEGDLGGADRLTEAERQLVRRAAVLAVLAESAEAHWLAGGELDTSAHNGTVNTLRRLFETVGLQRRSRDVTPSLADYIEAKS